MNLKLFFVFFSLTSSLARAETESINLSSTEERQAKTYTVAAQLLGYGPAASDLKGLHLGYFIDANTQWQLELLYGENPLIWGSSGHFIQSFLASTHLKLFTGNSFYIKLGLDYRHIKYRYEDPVLGSAYERTTFMGDSLGPSFTIGTQWQWSSLTLGVDWVGLSFPLLWQIETSSITGSVPNNQRRDKYEDRLLKENVLILSRLFIGASF